MKKVLAVFLVMLTLGVSAQAFAGNCEHRSDRAKDGSTCGERSADARKGGGGSY